MLQPLGISAEAEAVYVALAPLSSASVDELAKLTGTTPDEVRDTLEELRRLGLATESSIGHWRALPLLDVVNHLKAQRLSRDRAGQRRRRVAGEPPAGRRRDPGGRHQDPGRPGVDRRGPPGPAGLGQAGDLLLRQGARTSRPGPT